MQKKVLALKLSPSIKLYLSSYARPKAVLLHTDSLACNIHVHVHVHVLDYVARNLSVCLIVNRTSSSPGHLNEERNNEE